MATYINPNAIKDHSVTSIKLADGLIVTDASIAALGYIKDVSNLATKSAAIGSLSLALDSTNYKITLSGTKVDGSTFTVQNVIDLPLESVVVDGSYNNTTKKVVLTLQNNSTVEFSVADLVAGLQSEITLSNKLSADLIEDGTTNKTVTATEKSTWNSAVQPADLATVATTGNYSDLSGVPTPGPVYYALASAADLTFTKWNASVSGITSYYNGLTFIVANGSGASTESGSATFNVNGLGAKTISRSYLAGGGFTAQNLPANGVVLLTYYNNMFYLQAMLYNLADFNSDSTHRLVSDASTAAWNGKQDAISDLATIRENASTGAAKVSNVQSDWDATSGLAVILNKPTIPAAPGTLNTNNTTAQTANASEALSGTVKLHKVAKTGTYSDLIGTPAMTSDASVAGWGYTKNAGTITEITMNGTSKGTSGTVNLGTVITEHAAHKLTATNNTASATTGEITFIESLTGTNTATSGDLTITATRKKITVPSAVTSDTVSGWGFTKNTGTLTGVKFNNADATVTNGIASITATIPAAPGTLNTTATTAQSTSSNEALSGNITLHKVSKTGAYSDLTGTPTIPTVNNATLTIQKNGTTVQTFTANASSNATANITVNELPTVTSSDNGKVLMVVNGAWSMVTPVSIYSGSAAPNNSQGINGDIYLQV